MRQQARARSSEWKNPRKNSVKSSENTSKMTDLHSNGPFQTGHSASNRPLTIRRSFITRRPYAVCPIPHEQSAQNA
jgi:hypothetical protein